MTWPIPGDGFPYERRSRPATHPEAAAAWRVLTRLSDDALLRDERITVEVQNRVAILHGRVRSAQARDVAARLARGVDTVDEVSNRLRLARRRTEKTPSEVTTDPDPFDDIVRHLTDGTVDAPDRVAQAARAAAALSLPLAAVCALLLIPRDNFLLFAVVAAALTIVGVLYALRPGRA